MSDSGATDSEPIAVGATAITAAFADYLAQFQAVTRRAKFRFETRDWHAHQADALERLSLYPQAMDGVTRKLQSLLGNRITDRTLWAGIKRAHAQRADPVNFELARTFFNSVTRRIFSTVGVNADLEYTSLDLAILDWEPDPQILRNYEWRGGADDLVKRILADYRFDVPYRDPEQDCALVARRMDQRNLAALGTMEVDGVEVLRPVFYRNKAAYLVGRTRRGKRSAPWILALLNSPRGIFIDALLTDEADASILFSFTRSYFHVDAECPRALIVWLKAIIPLKPVSDLYSALGFNKHGKTELYRSLQRHMQRTADLFDFASGDRGLVMLVFTLPSYDRVFKVIRDSFDPPKVTTPRQVIERYRLVYQRDRVGRLVEAQRFRHLKIRRSRFAPLLLDELLSRASKVVRCADEFLVFEHVYTERKVTPLNVYLQQAGSAAARAAVIDYGAAIKELAAANIFPGDFLLKNFGVTRHGRVVFYDYDELCLLTDCRFRRMPVPRTIEDELASEPWFAVAESDVFPEEFRKFLGLSTGLLKVFEQHHGELFTVDFWLNLQSLQHAGRILDFFPYPPPERLGQGANAPAPAPD